MHFVTLRVQLVEIIQIHDCLRRALHEMKNEVHSLAEYSSRIADSENEGSSSDGSEDEYTNLRSSPVSSDDKGEFDANYASNLSDKVASRFHLIWSVFQAHSQAEDEFIWPTLKMKLAKLQPSNGSQNQQSDGKGCCVSTLLGQEEYEEDHAEEEAMFQQINSTLRKVKGSFRYYHSSNQVTQLLEKRLFIIRKVILLLNEQIDLGICVNSTCIS